MKTFIALTSPSNPITILNFRTTNDYEYSCDGANSNWKGQGNVTTVDIDSITIDGNIKVKSNHCTQRIYGQGQYLPAQVQGQNFLPILPMHN
jgi:hypothetical protein